MVTTGRIWKIAVFATGLAVVTGCAPTVNPAPPSEGASISDIDPISLRYASPYPETVLASTVHSAIMDEIEEASDGKVTFERIWNGSLLGAADMLTGVESGVTDLGTVLIPQFPSELPISGWTATMTNAAPDLSVGGGTAQGFAAFQDFMASNTQIAEEFESNGVHVLFGSGGPDVKIMCTSPVKSLADASGKLVRVGGALWAGEVEALGMVPQYTAATEMYEALQRGVLDCAAVTVDAARSLSLWDHTKYISDVPMSQGISQMLIVNNDVWNSLPPAVQEIFETSVKAGAQTFFEKGLSDVETVYAEATGEHDVEIVEVDGAVRDALNEFRSGVLDGLVESRPAALSEEDADAIVSEYFEILERWRGVVEQAGYTLGEVPSLEQDYSDKWKSVIDQMDW